jgi:asparaginyl-tRNA synthetase
MQKKYQTTDYLRTMPHLRLRTPLNSLLLRFRSKCRSQLEEFFVNAGYTHVDTPTLTSSDCEGGGETFTATTEHAKNGQDTFFKAQKYLTVSAQLHLEAVAQALGKVWTLSNTFRAEKSDTSRHLSEFKMLEAEVTFVHDVGEVMDLTENMLRNLVVGLYSTQEGSELIHGKRPTAPDDLEQEMEESRRQALLESRWQGMMSEHWPRITYTEAVTILKTSQENFEHEPIWGAGLKAEHEDYIATVVGKGSPVFVTCYPKAIKPFYMLSSAVPTDHGETVECFDLLVPDICEIVGGSLREHNHDSLVSNMQQKNLAPEGASLSPEDFGSLQWYVDLRNQGYLPAGGFGLGFDRLIMYLSGVKNIREVVTFPSWVGH